MPKWVYPLAFVFLIFVIYNDPVGAGSMAHAFADFVGRLISALGEFFSGLFGGTVADGSSTSNGIAPTLSTPALTGSAVTVPSSPTTDAFSHGHTHGYGG
jgi:hypothetical protein